MRTLPATFTRTVDCDAPARLLSVGWHLTPDDTAIAHLWIDGVGDVRFLESPLPEMLSAEIDSPCVAHVLAAMRKTHTAR